MFKLNIEQPLSRLSLLKDSNGSQLTRMKKVDYGTDMSLP